MALLLKRVNIILALIIISLSLGLIKFKNQLPHQGQSSFNVDAIVVLTGGRGERIIEGYNQINNSKEKKLFISGVDNTFNSEVVLINMLNFDQEKVECCIEVGYLSKNTYENALETRYWALEKKINSILKSSKKECELRRLDIENNTVDASYLVVIANVEELNLIINVLKNQYPNINISAVDQNGIPSI